MVTPNKIMNKIPKMVIPNKIINKKPKKVRFVEPELSEDELSEIDDKFFIDDKLKNQKLLSSKITDQYPDQYKKIIQILSFNNDCISKNTNCAVPIGSASYKIQHYPSDFDLLDSVVIGCKINNNEPCTRNHAINTFVKGVQEITERFNGKDSIFLELKCGKDHSFYIPEFYGPDMPQYYFDINVMLTNENFSAEDKTDLHFLLEQIKTDFNDRNHEGMQLNYIEIDNILRKYYIMRWIYDQVITNSWSNGETLNDAIDNGGLRAGEINIEGLSVLNGRITNVSNFFALVYVDSNNNPYAINLKQDTVDNPTITFVENIKVGIVKAGLYERFFKMAKRYWSLGKFIDDKNLLNKLEGLLGQNDIGLAYQNITDLNVIIPFLNQYLYGKQKFFKFNNVHDVLRTHCNILKEKVQYNTFLLNEEISSIIKIINIIETSDVKLESEVEELNKLIEMTTKQISKRINIGALNYLRERNLLFSEEYIPDRDSIKESFLLRNFYGGMGIGIEESNIDEGTLTEEDIENIGMKSNLITEEKKEEIRKIIEESERINLNVEDENEKEKIRIRKLLEDDEREENARRKRVREELNQMNKLTEEQQNQKRNLNNMILNRFQNTNLESSKEEENTENTEDFSEMNTEEEAEAARLYMEQSAINCARYRKEDEEERRRQLGSQ